MEHMNICFRLHSGWEHIRHLGMVAKISYFETLSGTFQYGLQDVFFSQLKPDAEGGYFFNPDLDRLNI